MKETGHDKNAPSENLSDTEQEFLKRYSLKKVTVPQEMLGDIVNLTVQNDEENIKEWLNPKHNENTTRKSEHLEYRDLSEVMRPNVPWWLGVRGALNNLSGQRLVSLVEEAGENFSFHNKRLEAGVEKNFKKMDTKRSVDTKKILSRGIEACLMGAGKNARTSAKTVKNIKKNKTSVNKNSNLTSSADLSWIEERLNRVQKLLMSLEDLRLRSGCEKCQGHNNKHGEENDPNSVRRRSSLYSSDVMTYAKELTKNTSESLPDDCEILEAKICKCDLDIIDKEISDLYCFLQELAEKKTSYEDKNQYEMIMCRVQEIRQCFCKFATKILENSQSTSAQGTQEQFEEIQEQLEETAQFENRDYLEEFGNHSNKECSCQRKRRNADCLAAGSRFLDPPEAWCAQLKQNATNNCTRMLFVPCFYYDPETGECKFTESDKQQYQSQFGYNSQNNQYNDEQSPSCTCKPPVFKKKFPLNLDEMISQITAIRSEKILMNEKSKAKGKEKEKESKNNNKPKEETEKKKREICDDLKNHKNYITRTDMITEPAIKRINPALRQQEACSNHSVGKILLENMRGGDTQETGRESLQPECQELLLQETLQETSSRYNNNENTGDCCCQQEIQETQGPCICIPLDTGPDVEQSTDQIPNDPNQVLQEGSKSESESRPNEEFEELSNQSNNYPRFSSAETQEKLKEEFEEKQNQELSNQSNKHPRFSSAEPQKQVNNRRSSTLAIKVSILDNCKKKRESQKSRSANDPVLKSPRPSVTFRNQPTSTKELDNEVPRNSIVNPSEEVSRNSFKRQSDFSDNLNENLSNATYKERGTQCKAPCCCTCKKSPDDAVDKSTQLNDPSKNVRSSRESGSGTDQKLTKQPKLNESRHMYEELLKNYEICQDGIKPILDPIKINHSGKIQSHSQFGSFLPKRNPFSTKPTTPSRQQSQNLASNTINENSDSVVTVRSASGGDAPKSPFCQCCSCKGVPPIDADLGKIIQNRIKHRERGTVYLKFTMTSNNLFHIQMATINDDFLGCFYATEAAVLEARRTDGFAGCITLSVMEASNSPSQVNRLVDHAFMVVQQEKKSKP